VLSVEYFRALLSLSFFFFFLSAQKKNAGQELVRAAAAAAVPLSLRCLVMRRSAPLKNLIKKVAN
jgi:hypothetical protein